METKTGKLQIFDAKTENYSQKWPRLQNGKTQSPSQETDWFSFLFRYRIYQLAM